MMNLPAFVQTAAKSYGGNNYSVITLDNAALPNTDLKNRLYRSVIKNEAGNIVSIAPLKSLENADFALSFQHKDKIRVTEMIEGTMINLFYDGNHWEIATKKSIGCDYHYFRTSYEGFEAEQKTFRQMFYDAIGCTDLAEFVAKYGFAEDHCYSFVLQHPANHIVLPIKDPCAYLVSCFRLTSDVDMYKMVDVYNLSYPVVPRCFNCYSGPIEPLDHGFFDGKDKVDYIVGTAESVYETDVLGGINAAIANPLNKHTVCGLMITNLNNGFRTGFVNPVYMEVKLLRGNNPNLHYQYLVLRKTNKVTQFLDYFPQYIPMFKDFKGHFKTYVARLHTLYMNVHVLKITKIEEVEDKRDKYHVTKLHFERYLPALRNFKQNGGNKPKINLREVYLYLDSEGVIAPF